MGSEHKVIFSPRSGTDLKEIVFYIRKNSGSPEIATRLGTALIEKALSLARLPERGRIVPELGLPKVREIIFRSYRIVYRITPDRIQILRFWHAARGAPDINVDEFPD